MNVLLPPFVVDAALMRPRSATRRYFLRRAARARTARQRRLPIGGGGGGDGIFRTSHAPHDRHGVQMPDSVVFALAGACLRARLRNTIDALRQEKARSVLHDTQDVFNAIGAIEVNLNARLLHSEKASERARSFAQRDLQERLERIELKLDRLLEGQNATVL